MKPIRPRAVGIFRTRAELEEAIWRMRAMTGLSAERIAERLGTSDYTVNRVLSDSATKPTDLLWVDW